MSDLDVAALLEAVGGDDPCGPDLRYDPEFQQLEEMARGTPEREMGDKFIPAEEPKWAAVRDAAIAVLKRSKDLQAAAILYKALVRTEGLAGAEQGLRLVRGLLERYWEGVHPRPDPSDPEDFVERMNVLLSLADFDTSLRYLREAPLVRSRQLGSFSLRHHRLATGKLKLPSDSGEEAPQLSRIEAALAELADDPLKTGAATAQRTCEDIAAIAALLGDKGGISAPDLTPLALDLREIRQILDAEVARRGGNAEAGQDGSSPGGTGSGGGGDASGTGEIRSRDDVLRMLDRICDYYARQEPSSPVPLLLQRAKRLVARSFPDIIRDLTPAGLGELNIIAGLENDSG